ncbi:MAG: right-handed parallel beta-helix repeat-containing protein, partial [Oscillospiraceae bacterium]|nr:right-handed parallel beta-helix repeat-containing protein [Oscillospiraceae bacterium]
MNGGTISGCNLHDNGGTDPSGTTDIMLASCNNILVENNTIDNQTRVDPNPDGGGIDFEGAVTNSIVRNNIVSDCDAYGVFFCGTRGAPN